MISKILVESRPLETRAALIEDGKLSEIFFERDTGDALTGNIYIGRVETVLTGMQAAFVNIGLDKNAFLPFSECPSLCEGPFLKPPVKVGQELPVQINKISGGEKGPRVTGKITLPGRMCVLMPMGGGIGVSKKIEDEEKRAFLHKIAKKLVPDGMGVIIRTNAEDAEKSDIESDLNHLLSLWETLSIRLGHIKAPVCVYKDHSIVFRCVRDYLSGDISEMLVEGESAYKEAMETARLFAPELSDRITKHVSDIPLFHLYSVKKQLEEALSRRVWLKSGGFLIFDKTEALTVIDVNTGKFTGKKTLDDTIFKLNLEAAQEIARQIRLRDIGGIIVIDFIDMLSLSQKDELVKALREHFKRDRTHTNVLGITALGLIEMTRRKVREPLETYFKSPCPLCRGEGRITSPEAVCYDAFSQLEQKFLRSKNAPLLLKVSKRVYDKVFELAPRLSGCAYCATDESVPGHEFIIEEADESRLPPKSRKITGE